MNKLEKLTRKQQALTTIIRDEWINLCHSGKDLTMEEIEDDIEWLYHEIKLPKPKILLFDSYIAQKKGINEVVNKGKKPEFIEHYFGLGYDCGWLAYYDFYDRIGHLKKVTPERNYNRFCRYRDMMKKGIWSFVVYDKICFISKLPLKIHKLDNTPGTHGNSILHNTGGPAVEWRDGNDEGLYRLFNIQFDKELWKKAVKHELNAEEILTLTNIEQRMAVFKLYGSKFILDSFKHKLIDEDHGGVKLYELIINSRTKWKMLEYKDTSTDRLYHSLVPPATETTIEGLSWKFSSPTYPVSTDEYHNLETES